MVERTVTYKISLFFAVWPMVFIDNDKEKSNACKAYLSSLVVSYRHSATFHSPILGDMLPPDASILNPENAPGQTIRKEDRRLEIRLPVSRLEWYPGCHPERSEGSLRSSSQTLRGAYP